MRVRGRVDVQTRKPGLEFQDAWEHRGTSSCEGQPLLILSRDDLVLAKRAAGRRVELEDVRLRELPDG